MNEQDLIRTDFDRERLREGVTESTRETVQTMPFSVLPNWHLTDAEKAVYQRLP